MYQCYCNILHLKLTYFFFSSLYCLFNVFPRERGTATGHVIVTDSENKPVRTIPLTLLAVGTSVSTQIGTTNDGITAPLLIVRDFTELDAAHAKGLVKDSIVLYNYVYTLYSDTVAYRSQGAKRAEAYGAKGVLIRSVCPFSLNTPHTGTMSDSGIPAACVTIENAELLERLVKNGNQVHQ